VIVSWAAFRGGQEVPFQTPYVFGTVPFFADAVDCLQGKATSPKTLILELCRNRCL